jgi:hypothetical protein
MNRIGFGYALGEWKEAFRYLQFIVIQYLHILLKIRISYDYRGTGSDAVSNSKSDKYLAKRKRPRELATSA